MSKCHRRQHVVSLLTSREYSHRGNQLRTNLRVLRTLVCGDNYEFRKVWEKTSRSVIRFEGDKVFLDNYKTVYDGYGVIYSAPVRRFSIPAKKLPQKIVDCLLSYSSPTKLQTTSSPTAGPGTKIYGITDSSLLAIDFKSGQIMSSAVFQTYSGCNLTEISWVHHEDTFVISSTLFPADPRQLIPRSRGTTRVVKLLALFAVQPLRFVCMFEITRKVFGKDVIDAQLRDGILIVMHRQQAVHFYDFNHLLQKHEITPQLIENSAQVKINMVITERPCCLFETQSEGCDVQVGANPWHYLTSPVGTRHTFHVNSLQTGHLAQGGVLTSTSDSIEWDRAVFHTDDSNRVIHISQDEVRVLWIKQDQGKSIVTPHFTIPVHEHVCSVEKSVHKAPEVTSSGRIVKRRFSLEALYGEDVSIREVCYEDELELMVVCSTIFFSHTLKGRVGLYHNAMGRLLKSVQLDEPKPHYLEHRTALDRDTLVQVTKYSNGTFLVQVYRLCEKCAPDEFRKDYVPAVKGRHEFRDDSSSDPGSP